MNEFLKYTEKLTYLQKVALEGEIATCISSSNHDADIVYHMYTILFTIPKEYYSFVLGSFRNLCDIPNDTFIKVRNEVAFGEVPMWIWRNKCIADIKESLAFASQGHPEISANLKSARKKIIESAFILFCRRTSLFHGAPVIELCNEILNDSSLEFLHTSCIFLKEELKEVAALKQNKKVLKQVMGCCFDIRDTLSFKIEYEEVQKSSKPVKVINPKTAEKAVQAFINAIAEAKKSDIEKSEAPKFENIPNNFLNATIKTEEFDTKSTHTQFIVKKVFKNSGKETTLRTFKTEDEARGFVMEIINKFPELKGTCSFVIEHAYLKKR